MADARAVEAHYARRSLGDTILAALREAGKDLEHLTPDDLAPVDEFHSGQRNATVRLAQLARVSGSEAVLDVGCGIGGPSRFLAKEFGCRVTGLDLTAEFIEVANMLARRTGLAGKVTYHRGDALDLPFADASFDLAWSQNAAMNIADRDRLYAEMRRVLKPNGRLAIQDVAAGPGGEPYYPTPWAKDKSISFLFPPQITRETGARRIPGRSLARSHAGIARAGARARQGARDRHAAAARDPCSDRAEFPHGVEEHGAQSRGKADRADQRYAGARGLIDSSSIRSIVDACASAIRAARATDRFSAPSRAAIHWVGGCRRDLGKSADVSRRDAGCDA